MHGDMERSTAVGAYANKRLSIFGGSLTSSV